MITILTWVSIITGGLLVIFMLLSLLGGLDLDIDTNGDVDTDSGGIGLLKGFLTFIAVSSWVIKILLSSDKNPGVAVFIGLISGLVAYLILYYLFKLLLSNEENVNWDLTDALYQKGEVYLRIPGHNGSGLIHVNVNGALRELKAKAFGHEEIKTGTRVIVVDIDDEYAVVQIDQ